MQLYVTILISKRNIFLRFFIYFFFVHFLLTILVLLSKKKLFKMLAIVFLFNISMNFFINTLFSTHHIVMEKFYVNNWCIIKIKFCVPSIRSNNYWKKLYFIQMDSYLWEMIHSILDFFMKHLFEFQY